MKYFRYLFTPDELIDYKGEVSAVPPTFIKSKISLAGLSVYYKLEGGKIKELIGEAFDEKTAKKRVNEFLSAFLSTSFESL